MRLGCHVNGDSSLAPLCRTSTTSPPKPWRRRAERVAARLRAARSGGQARLSRRSGAETPSLPRGAESRRTQSPLEFLGATLPAPNLRAEGIAQSGTNGLKGLGARVPAPRFSAGLARRPARRSFSVGKSFSVGGRALASSVGFGYSSPAKFSGERSMEPLMTVLLVFLGTLMGWAQQETAKSVPLAPLVPSEA